MVLERLDHFELLRGPEVAAAPVSTPPEETSSSYTLPRRRESLASAVRKALGGRVYALPCFDPQLVGDTDDAAANGTLGPNGEESRISARICAAMAMLF